MCRTVFLLSLLALPEARADGPTPPPLTVTSPGRGRLSLAVYDGQGQMIRGLLYAQPVEAGPQPVAWDGTTQLGLPASPGTYHVRGVWFPEPPKIDFAMKVGLSGNPPYYADDNRGAWGGNLGPPQDICSNGKNLLAIFACVESAKTTGIQLMDLDGNIVDRFTSFFGWDVRQACAMDDRNLYMAFSAGGAKKLYLGKYDLDKPPRGKILCEIPAGDHSRADGLWKGTWQTDVRGLALSEGRLYVPVFPDGKLFVVDASSGAILKTVDVPSPRGVAARDGKVFLLSGASLLQIDADGSPLGAPLVTGLDDPFGLALDAKGNFYVSDRGASQQVKVFSPDGSPLRQVGVKGGRPREGAYDPAGLLDPRGLCVAPDGKLWVTSSAEDFQTVTAWDGAGRLAKTFYNCRISSGLGRLSPDRSEMLATFRDFSDSPGVNAYKIDWARKTWAPSWHITMTEEMMQHEDVFIGNGHLYGQPAKAFAHVPYLGMEDGMVKGTNGKTYLVGGDFSIWLFDPEAKKARLASFVWTHRAHKTPDGRYEGDYDQGAKNWLTWADLDGDGKMALDEVGFVENPPLLANVDRFSGWKLQPDLSIVFLGGEKIPGAAFLPGAWNLYRLPAHQVLPSGVPVYDWRDLAKVTTLQVPVWNGGDGEKDPAGANVDQLSLEDGAAYVSVAARSRGKLHLTGVDGDGWWASRNWRLSPMKFDLRTGAPSWLKLGNRAPGRAQPGQMYYPAWGIAGSVDGIDYVADAISQVWAWTDDGLYLGPIYHDNTGGNIFDADSIFAELVGSFAYKIDGKTYLLTGDHGVSVHEVHVPKLTPVDAGTVSLTPGMAAAAKPWDPDGPPPGKRPAYVARSIFDFDKAAPGSTRTITVDGRLDPAEWGGVREMELDRDGKKVGTVRVAFDKENLYLAYAVDDPNGLRNDGHELPYSPFVSGSYVDFAIGRDWQSPNRPDPAEGDVRVILARITGAAPADYQMGYWPVRQNLRAFTPPPKKLNPQEIVSPAQKRHFDDISPVPGLVCAYQVQDKGYTLEVSVPFASLGINPARNATVGFDASVAFTDASGQVRSRAVHWAGESEAEVVDRPGSAELKPATWGSLEFERDPLPAFAPDTARQ